MIKTRLSFNIGQKVIWSNRLGTVIGYKRYKLIVALSCAPSKPVIVSPNYCVKVDS